MPNLRIYEKVAGNHPGLNRFDLSYTNTTSMKFGVLYPVQCDEVYPGDYWKMSAFVHAEIAPMVTPLMSDIQMYVHSFFVPYRLLYGYADDGQSIFEKYITGGQDGDYDTPLPSWQPNVTTHTFSSGLIWDYVGNPMSFTASEDSVSWTPIVPHSLLVSIAPKYAYNFIWNNYYRSEDLNDEVDFSNEYLLNVNFKKDYFTSAALFQQRGTAPALPVDINVVWPSLTGSVVLDGSITGSFTGSDSFIQYKSSEGKTDLANSLGTSGINFSASSSGLGSYDGIANIGGATTSRKPFYTVPNGSVSINNGLSISNGLVLSTGSVNATTFTPSDLRLAFAIQRMQELSARSGYRYTEYLQAHFGVHPTDARLDRPEYLGGFVTNVTVSPTVQTSSTDGTTPQGNKVGIANIDTIQKIGNYRVLEYGLIMTLVNIVPKPIYSQGINRQWLRQTRWDFYNPALAFLSEQNIYGAEIYTDGLSEGSGDDGIFGYQAHWNEMRGKQNMLTGSLREQFDYWTLARKFSNRPALNADFLKVVDSDFNRIFAVQNEDPFIVSFSNIIDAYRPLPAMGVPGLIDHVYGGY